MDGSRNRDQDQVINQMTRVILTEMLERVLREFERTTGTRIGTIHMRAEDPVSGQRRTEIEIQNARGGSLDALMNYKKILCEYENVVDEALCNSASDASEEIDYDK